MAILHLGILLYLSPVNGLFHHCIIFAYVFLVILLWMLYLWLLRYVCVLYTIWSLVALHLGNLVMHIFWIWIVMPFSPSLLTYSCNSGLTYLCLNYFSHALKHIYLLPVSQYLIYLFILNGFFCCLLLSGHIFTWNIQYSKTHIQHHIYNIFEQVFSFSCFTFRHNRLHIVTLITREVVLSYRCKIKQLPLF